MFPVMVRGRRARGVMKKQPKKIQIDIKFFRIAGPFSIFHFHSFSTKVGFHLRLCPFEPTWSLHSPVPSPQLPFPLLRFPLVSNPFHFAHFFSRTVWRKSGGGVGETKKRKNFEKIPRVFCLLGSFVISRKTFSGESFLSLHFFL